jgi:hypothetical protein
LDAECSMMVNLSVSFWVSSEHLNHVRVKSPKWKHLYVVENYRAMMKWSKTKVKKELTC